MTLVAFAIADIGVSASSVAAARIAITHGVVRNISVQTVLPHLHRVRDELAGLPGIALGLHAAVTCEWSHPRLGPLLGCQRVPALCDPDGAFCASALVLFERRVPVIEQVMDELRAQLHCLRSFRIPVTYVDEHMAFGWLPGMAAALEDFRRREGLMPIRPLQQLPELVVPQRSATDRLLGQLMRLPDGAFIAAGHPCLIDDEMRRFRMQEQPGQDIARERHEELLMFTDPRVVDLVRSGRVDSVRFDER